MKMNYTAPEAKLLGFAPAEATATDFDNLLGGNGGQISDPSKEAQSSAGDITIEGVSF